MGARLVTVMRRSLPVCILLVSSVLQAQPTPLRGAAELQELLDRLNTVGTVLMLGAHPDGREHRRDGVLRSRKASQDYLFSATRGEGGQNRIGTEQSELMGVIRTHELLRGAPHRRRRAGIRQRGRFRLFQNAGGDPESLGGGTSLLRDMVRVIRQVRPDVIVSRFPPRPGSGGHGQHTAVGWTGPVAFEAASRSPAISRTRPSAVAHAPLLLQRADIQPPGWNKQAAGQPGRLRVELGDYDPVLGKSFAEIAGESRSMHRSQAMGTGQRKGSVPTFFEHVAGERAADDLFSGIDVSWGRIEGGASVGAKLAQARDGYDPRKPDAILPLLLEAYQALKRLPRT